MIPVSDHCEVLARSEIKKHVFDYPQTEDTNHDQKTVGHFMEVLQTMIGFPQQKLQNKSCLPPNKSNNILDGARHEVSTRQSVDRKQLLPGS